MSKTVYIAGWSAWAPGMHTRKEWLSWASTSFPLTQSAELPSLEFVDPLFKRRFSQLTRMTIQVGHEALSGRPPMKISFASVYGEITQQHRITTKLIEENEVSPAHFSLSVFNTPVAALSIVEKNTEGYVACYPGMDSFKVGFLESAAAILSGAETSRLFIIADEFLPPDYVPLQDGPNQPYALALVLSGKAESGSVAVNIEDFSRWKPATGRVPDALQFLRETIISGRNMQ